jgi:hypothetical protein
MREASAPITHDVVIAEKSGSPRTWTTLIVRAANTGHDQKEKEKMRTKKKYTKRTHFSALALSRTRITLASFAERTQD